MFRYPDADRTTGPSPQLAAFLKECEEFTARTARRPRTAAERKVAEVVAALETIPGCVSRPSAEDEAALGRVVPTVENLRRHFPGVRF